ncbi:alginate export family protein [Novosphingobium sp. Chol11]|uniref:alginate export family protein n=1 Tax=Novosphingobium sp. Chol11 TaxID=1385763 RepID=UPI0025EBFABF|nr:alginate export family protein [Novosphingobium sp. Chol11]
MNRRARLLVLIAASGLAARPAAAQTGVLAHALGAPDDLTITATVRARVETIANQFRPNAAENDTMFSVRTALAAELDAGPVRFGAEVWDARAYGQAANSSVSTTDVNAFELVQAYARIEFGDWAKGGKGGKGLLTLGRFTLDVGSRRLLARNRFRNTTNGFTGAHAEWTTAGGAQLLAFWAMPQLRRPDDRDGLQSNRLEFDLETTGVQFFGGHAAIPRVPGGALEGYVYRLTEKDGADRLTRNRRLWTVGLRHFARPAQGKWDHDVEAAYQFGKVRRSNAASDMADLAVSAWFVHAEMGYSFTAGWKPRLSVSFYEASGDGGKPGRFGRFDTLFGARRFDFGPTALYGPIGRANLVSPGARLELVPGERTDAMIGYRAAWAQNARDAFSATGVRDASGQSGRFAGHQIEARLRHWLVPGLLQVDTGGAVLIKRGLLRAAPNAPATGNTVYGYVDLILTL